MSLPHKAESVDQRGRPDGFQPALAWTAQVVPGGYSRLIVNAPGDRLAAVHQALCAVLQPPLKVLYRQLTDRTRGQLPKPIDWVGVEVSRDQLLITLQECAALVYHDGRHQLWVRGALGEEQVVLEEIGVIYAYPDDPAFRDALAALGVEERAVTSMAERDYVKVNFVASADAEEQLLRQRLGLSRWS